MSLSERLRQEFGLDDSTDDEEHKAGMLVIYRRLVELSSSVGLSREFDQRVSSSRLNYCRLSGL